MTVECETVEPRWNGLCVVAATGFSLTPDVAEACRGHRVVAVNDAYRRMPFADVLYACDAKWWEQHQGCPNFRGEKWSSHQERSNDKLKVARKYGLRLVRGNTAPGFSSDQGVIHYGSNSGFQAINLALLFGGNPVVLVGFNLSGSHFFGSHPRPLIDGNPASWIPRFEDAAQRLPKGVEIINCTPKSALTCFPTARVEDVL